MIAWMVYVLVVAVVLSAAALLAESCARQRKNPSRWIWLTAMAGTVLMPLVISISSLHLSQISSLAAPQTQISNPQEGIVALPMPLLALSEEDEASISQEAGTILKLLWLLSSLALLSTLATSAVLVLRRKRQWPVSVFEGIAVHTAPDVGPAVVGLLGPRIVIPAWLAGATAVQKRIVIAHEQSHLDAHDPQLLSLALCLLSAMPWNLPLWWQIARLRRAIEVDCDARVLQMGHGFAEYGETLLAVGQRRSAFVGVAAAMSEPASFLEQRLRIMLKKPAKYGRWMAVGLGILTVALVAAATELTPPNVKGLVSGAPTHILLEPQVLASYAGDYQAAEREVIHLAYEGRRIFVQFTGRPRYEVWASNETVLSDIHGNIAQEILRDDTRSAAKLIIHRRGLKFTAHRISATQAESIANAIAAKVKDQTPSPGSEAAVRRLFAQTLQDPPDLNGMDELVAAGMKEQNDTVRPVFAKLGAVKSVEFAGVFGNGSDMYLMHCAGGDIFWWMLVDTDGTITRVNFKVL